MNLVTLSRNKQVFPAKQVKGGAWVCTCGLTEFGLRPIVGFVCPVCRAVVEEAMTTYAKGEGAKL